ncbi:MAG: hypothetical protein HC904_03140 [Blastochloris sp.]|nr:hypothetical protein [Blastochloris sp.]
MKQGVIGKQGLIGLILGLLLGCVVSWFLTQGSNSEKTPIPAAPVEENLSLESENILLKKMLGQLKARVVLLGPAVRGSEVQGRLVWDKNLQEGFLQISGLNPSAQYGLYFKENSGNEVEILSFQPESETGMPGQAQIALNRSEF